MAVIGGHFGFPEADLLKMKADRIYFWTDALKDLADEQEKQNGRKK